MPDPAPSPAEAAAAQAEPAEPEPGGLALDVEVADPSLALPAGAAPARWVAAARHAAGDEGPASLVLRIVDRAEGRALNAAWRDRDYATNVLAFPGPELPPEIMAETGRVLGDLVICLPVVAEEAVAQGKPLVAHLAHLVVHGSLHLLGYTHEGDSDAAEMEQLEVRVLAALGWPDPYATESLSNDSER
ncbi:MAG: rRNA maturation RNase YbeY [Chromatiales bacterium]|nr:rRNA maturation RNase YbeY [Chromatiales bacterium]